MAETHPSICRLCTAFCPILVDVEDGRAIKVVGDPGNDLYRGYTCPKGRALPEMHSAPERLLHSLKRDDSGGHAPIGVEQAMDEIAARVQAIVAEHGPRAVALYIGTGALPYPPSLPASRAWLQGIGSPMFFTPGSIDQPGKSIAAALHGGWEAGEQTFDGSDTYLLVGMNPVISKCHGTLGQNPGRKLKDAIAAGMRMIVIDPRRTETARRAALYLQPRPGEDPTLLAGIVRVIIAERLYDAAFVAENAEGLEAITAAVDGFTLDYVSERTGVAAEDIVQAAHIFSAGPRGCAMAGTGANFSPRGSVTEYLCLVLNTLCGRWARAGDVVPRPNVLLPAYRPRAQATAPFRAWGGGERMRVRDLGASAVGLPTAALSDEILLEGEGRVRALICVAGNPMMAWPDQRRAQAAMEKLDLLVCVDPLLSATGEFADYVIAPKLSFETPGMSQAVETLKYYGFGLGYPRPWAQYAPRIAQPPPGSELIEDWQLFHGLARRMGFPLKIRNGFRAGSHAEASTISFTLDPDQAMTSEEFFEAFTANSRIPLEEVKRNRNGRIYDEVDDTVLPRDPDHGVHLQIGDPYIVGELAAIRSEDHAAARSDELPFLLVSRRTNNILNSIGRNIGKLSGGKGFNPLHLHPEDLAALGLVPGQGVLLRSAYDGIPAVVEADDSLRRGVVSMTHAFGGKLGEDHRYREIGSNVGRLISAAHEYDPITGIPRMSAIPVAITPLPPAEEMREAAE